MAGAYSFDAFAAGISNGLSPGELSGDVRWKAVALGLYDQDYEHMQEVHEERESMPRLSADAANFAQALSQDYRAVPGTLRLTEDSVFYLVSAGDRTGNDDSAENKDSAESKVSAQSEDFEKDLEKDPEEDLGIDPEKDLEETVSLMSELFATRGIPSDKPLEIVREEADSADTGSTESSTERDADRGIQDGDIVIELMSRDRFAKELGRHIDNAIIDQGYELCAEDHIELKACTSDGVYYGLLTLMEIAAGKGSDDKSADNKAASEKGASEKSTDNGVKGITLDRFRIYDAPDLDERIISVDCARKYFSKKWLEEFIRRSSLQRYNRVVLHFAEAECMRLDSEAFPWLTDGVKSLGRDEAAELVRLAKRYHIKIIPSFDTPGHNSYMVKKYAEYVKKNPDFSFTYDGKKYSRKTKGFRSIANYYSRGRAKRKSTWIGIDITSEHARAFTDAVIDDYAKSFKDLGCDEFDICGDEVLGWNSLMVGKYWVDYQNRWQAVGHWKKYARETLGIRKGSASDTFITYLNTVAERLEGMGYRCRVFNDEIDLNKDQHVRLRKSVGITFWEKDVRSAAHYADSGHTLYNAVEQWTYYVVGKDGRRDIMKSRYKTVDAGNIYDNWDPRSFSAGRGSRKHIDSDKFGGGCFFIWCDMPGYKSADEIMKETELRTWANSCRMWNQEVNSGRSGIRAAMSYDKMKAFALKMRS